MYMHVFVAAGKAGRLGLLPPLYQGCAGCHGQRTPQDRAGGASFCDGERPGQGHRPEDAGFRPEEAAGA